MVLALFPRLLEVRLEPDIVFLVFLPPLLYWDALNSSWRDFRENWRPISLLAIGLVFTTTMAVMVAAHFLLGFLWGPAFVLGAVLGPTDTVAAADLEESQLEGGTPLERVGSNSDRRDFFPDLGV